MKSIHHIRNRMRWLILSAGMMWAMLAAAQPNINKIEYFFDTDPGFGLGTNVTVTTPAVNLSSFSFSANLAPINAGFHTLYVRSRTTDGKWSLTSGNSIVKLSTLTAALGPIVKVNKIEYFFDTDPGFGLGTNVPVTAATDINSLAVPVSLSSLNGGFHKLYIRSRDSLGRWSMTGSSDFIKYAAQTAALGPVVKVNKIEYFIDTDPGFGLGTDVPVTAATDINSLAVPVSLASVTGGYHTLYIRSRDSLGRWSMTSNSAFVKYSPQTASLGPVVNINKMEYFFDTDPGFGLATNVPVTSATDINGMAISINISFMSGMIHTLYIRSRDSLGRWSLTNNGTFVKYVAQTAALSPTVRIVKLEYFIDIDPGVRNATAVNITPTTNLSGYVFAANLSTVSSGPHTLYVRSIDSLGRSSITNYGSFNGGTLQAPTATITVVGTQPLCAGTGYLRVNRDASPIATYQWKLGTTVVSSGVNDTIYYPTTSGSYTVIVTNTVSSATSSPVSVTVNPAPTATISAGGPLSFCQGSSVLLSVNQTSGAGYQWKINGGNIGGATTSTYTATSSGVYNVVVTGTNGCSTPSAKDTVTVTPGVTPTISITASQYSICTGAADSFFAAITGGGTSPVYQWKKNGVNVGTNSPLYVPGSLNNNDTIYCVLTSNAVCASPSVLTSNKIVMIVSFVSAPTVSVSASQTTLCSGASVTFTATPVNGGSSPTYQWYKNGVLQSSVTNTFTTSVLSNNDSVWAVLTSNSVCASTPNATSNHVRVTVNPTVTPSVSIIATQSTICASGVDTFTATPVNGGASPFYQWYRNGVLQTSNNNNTYITSLNNNDSVWVVMTSNAACPSPSTATSNHIRVNVTATVVPTISITASQSSICAGDSVTFTASITNGGTPSYQWKKNGVNVGTNSAIYGTRALLNNDSVWCVLTSNAVCASPTVVNSNHIRITVNAVTAPQVSITASQNNICANTSVTLTATPVNGGASPTYVWYQNGVVQSSVTNTFTTSALSNNDSVWVVMTSNSACATVPTATSNKIIMIVSPTVTPSVTVSASFTTICTATSDTFRATPVNGGANPSYQWYRNGVLQAGNTNTFITTALSNNDSVWCVMTSNASCPSPATATSNHVRITVNSYVTPTIVVSASPGSMCAGDSVTFTASTTNGGGSPTYQWKKNGVNVGGNSPIYGTRTILSTDSVWCVLTSNVPCPTVAIVTSNHVRVTVNTVVVPTITVSASQTTICTGNTVTFTASITNGGTNPSYAWYKNGALVSVGSSTYSDNTLANNDSVWCVLTSTNACASPASVTSNHVIITIISAVVPAVSVSTAQTSVCAGIQVTFTANPTNGGSNPTYQWYKNGILQAGNTGSFGPISVLNNDSVWCVMTSNASCVSPTTATSNHVHMTVTPIVVPTISVSAVPTTICAGDSVTFTATIINGGANPTYQWKKNGANVGNGSAVYGIRGLVSTDSVWCVLTSTATCATPASVSSNHIRITVNPIVTPSVSVSVPQTTICPNTALTFTATPVNGGANPTYTWYRNGVIQSGTSGTFTISSLSNNDSVWVVLTSNATCATTNTATSNHVIITVTTSVTPSVTISTPQTTVCANTSVTFTATATNGGANPTYQWYKNGVLQSGNTGTFTTSSLANNDSVWCVLTSNALCVSPATATSNHVIMTINPIVTPTIVITASTSAICAGDSVTFSAAITNGGANPSYQWVKNGLNVGSGLSTYGTRSLASTDSVWCVLTSSANCPSPSSVASNHVRITVNPIVTPTISVSATQTTICIGTTVTFTASITNGGPNPIYQWYKNGVLQSSTSSTYSSGGLADGDSVWCVLTSSAICTSVSTVSSNHLIITISTSVYPGISIATASNTVCAGSTVTFTATAFNGGASPFFNWYKNGILQTGNTNTYTTSSLSTNDSIWSIMTSSAACASPDTALSNQIRMNVIQPVFTTYSMTICPGSVYSFNGTNVSQAGTYYDTLAAASTCDSIVVLTLSLYAQPLQVITASICPADSFDFRGVEIYSAGTYDDTLIAAGMNGCDSIIRLALSIRPILTSTHIDTVCFGASAAFGTHVYTASGTYIDTLTGSNGCDSISTLYLTVSPQVTSSYSAYTCQGHPYTFGGNALTTGGTYADTLTSVRGCDSIIYLTLTIRPTSAHSIADTICEGNVYVFNSMNLTQSGSYLDTVAGVNTCDSIITLNLVVIPRPVPVATLHGVDTLRLGGTYTSYQWYRNNVLIQNATGQSHIATQNGSYTVIVFNAFGCSDTSVAVSVTHVGIEDITISSLHVYPNPAENILHIEADNLSPNTTLKLIDAIGRNVYELTATGVSVRETIDISSYASGIYLLTIESSGKVYATKRIIKE